MLHTWHYSVVFFHNPVSGFPHTATTTQLRKRIWGKNGRKKRRKTRQQRKRKVYNPDWILLVYKYRLNWSGHSKWVWYSVVYNAVSTWNDKFHHVLFLKTNKLYHVLTLCSESKSEESEGFHFFSFRLRICCLWCNENSIVIVGSRGEVPTNHKAWKIFPFETNPENLSCDLHKMYPGTE